MSEVVLFSRRFEQDGYTIIVDRVLDNDMECETPESQQSNYDGCTDAEKAEYFEQDKARYEAYQRSEWSYIGIAVRILKQTKSNWANGGLEVGRSSVWGIESDSEESYLLEVEQDQISEALREVQNLKTALCGFEAMEGVR